MICNKLVEADCVQADACLQTEKYLKASGLEYVVVRPGGLKNDPESEVGNLILKGEDALRAKKSDPATSISRETVLPATSPCLGSIT